MRKLDKEDVLSKLEKEGPPFWYHTIEVIPGSGIFTPGKNPFYDFDQRLRNVGVDPLQLEGKRVLDIGAWAGAFSFYLEEHGAEVIALDVQDPRVNGFSLLHEMRDSNVEHRMASIYDLHPEMFGEFDIVGFFGVFYHLKHPLLAMERINSVLKMGGLLIGGGTTSDAWIHTDDDDCKEGMNLSQLTKEKVGDPSILSCDCANDISISAFANNQFLRDRTNWFIPNCECLKGWMMRSGFETKKFKWNRNPVLGGLGKLGVYRTNADFSAIKIGEAEREYTQQHYEKFSKKKNFPVCYEFDIPTGLEVHALKDKIAAMELEIAELKR